MKSFRKLRKSIGALGLGLALSLVVGGLNPASAVEMQSSFMYVTPTAAARATLGTYLGVEVSHPVKVACRDNGTSKSCSFQSSARLTERVKGTLTIRLVDEAGTKLTQHTVVMPASSKTGPSSAWDKWTEIFTVDGPPKVHYEIVEAPASYALVQGTVPRIDLIWSPTPASAEFVPTWQSDIPKWQVGAVSSNETFRFMNYYLPEEQNITTECAEVPVWVRPIDIFTGQTTSDPETLANYSFTATRLGGSEMEQVAIPAGGAGWEKSATPKKLVLRVCDLNRRKGVRNVVDLDIRAKFQGFSGEEMLGSTIVLIGQAVFKDIACKKGSTVKLVSSEKPVCPSGFKPAQAKIVNGKLLKYSIRCMKSLKAMRVTGYSPTCPAGWRRG